MDGSHFCPHKLFQNWSVSVNTEVLHPSITQFLSLHINVYLDIMKCCCHALFYNLKMEMFFIQSFIFSNSFIMDGGSGD